MPIRRLILALGLLNAALYSALLPLWEGFDEAFHYSYVEALWQTVRLPVLGRALVPSDVSRSFPFAPVSHIVHRWIPGTTTFENWFALPEHEKIRRRAELESLRPDPASSLRPNYEAHHPPLAYAFLALADRLIRKAPLTVRVLILRLFGALSSVILIYVGATSLCRTLEMAEDFLNATLFTIFCSEMLYATIAHVANDWLAAGISAMFLAALAEWVRQPTARSTMKTSLWLAAGLLTKAYFLAFTLPAFAAAIVLIGRRRLEVKTALAGAAAAVALAGPWYARNFILYGNISGTHEEFDGIGIRQAIAAAPRIHWAATAGFLARGSLWTGNNSFTTFSRATLNLALALLFAAMAAWFIRRRLIRPPEQITLAAIAAFSIAVAYATCASFAHTRGEAEGASPWYTQALLVPVMSLAFLGMSRWKEAGSVLAAAITALWTWILIATWTIKLFPMYSGQGAAPMRFADVVRWYTHAAGLHGVDLSLVALAPAPLLYAALLFSVALSLLLCASILRRIALPRLMRRTGRRAVVAS